jgi:hypothetical protein
MTAIYELLGALRSEARLTDNVWLKSVTRSCSSVITKQSKYRDIWEIGILLDFLRLQELAENLSWSDLMRGTTAIFMVFIPLRPVAMLRLDPSNERISKTSKSIEVPTCNKTDSKREITYVVVRPLEDKRLCPLKHYRMIKEGAKKRGMTDTLWGTDKGKPFMRTDQYYTD